jgi:vacuolar protein sorting-associated protein 35
MNSVRSVADVPRDLSPNRPPDMAVFDALRHLSNYLFDAHTQGKHHLADLYELVQYAGNIVPRLYLMITVGSVYMSINDAPVKEVMKDMMEMSRGVLHPIRGLFLRHYLSGQTRDHLPIGVETGYVDSMVCCRIWTESCQAFR